MGVVSEPGVAYADPVGSVFTYTVGVGSQTSSIVLGTDDTIFASGYASAFPFGNATVQAIGVRDDTLTATPVEYPLTDLPAGSNGANAVASGPLTGPYANMVFVSSDSDNNQACDASTASRIQAYDPTNWTLVQTWELPVGHCPGSMAVGPDGRLWFQELYQNQVGRLSLDDSTVGFVAFAGSGSPASTGRVGVGLDGNMYFAAQGAEALLIVGTGTAGTTLDDTQLVALPSNTTTYDLEVADNGDVWILADTSGVRVYRPLIGAFVARTATLADGYYAKSIAQASDGTMWVLGSDFSNSRYYAYLPQFTPSTNSSAVNLAADDSFVVGGPPSGVGYLVAGPQGQGTLYRSTGTNSIQRIGVTVAPRIVSIEPPMGPSTGGSKLVISGTGLNEVTSVTIGGSAATIDDSTATTLAVTVPPGALGSVDVVVTSADGSDTLVNGFTYSGQLVLNSDGGTSIDGTDGLRLIVNASGVASPPISSSSAGDTGGEQILWSATTQYYSTNTLGGRVVPSVWIGDDSTTGKLFGNGAGYTASCPRCASWNSAEILSYDGVGPQQSASIRYTALYSSTPGDGQDDTYVMTRTLSYSDDTANAYRETWDFSFTMSSPTDDTETVKFYSGGDTAPGGDDRGFGEQAFVAATGVRTISSMNPTPSVGIQVGYRTLEATDPRYKDFDGAAAVALGSGIFPLIQTGGDIGFQVDQSQHDASMAMQWNIPDSGGTYSFETFVSRYRSLTSSSFSPSSISADDTSLMTLTLSNPQFSAATGLAFDLDLPGQLALADDSVTTTCGGATVAGGTDDTQLSLSGGTLAARLLASPGAIPSCTVTAQVRPRTAGTFTLNASSVTATSTNLTNIVVPQTLTVAASAPPAPALNSVTPGDGSLTLGWTLQGDGGNAITAVEYSTDDSLTWTALPDPNAVSAQITSASGGGPLVNGVTYDVRVRAVNGIGNGAVSNTLQGTPAGGSPTPGVPPSAPVNVSAVAGDVSAVVSWTPPVNEGSFAITDYRVVASPGGATCLAKAPATSCTVDRLTNDVTYTFTVQALNGVGWGAMSEPSNAVTPVPRPTPTMMVTGSRGTGANADRVFANGVTMHLVGRQVQARVHLSGQVNYENGSVRTVASDGTFTWQRRTKKTVYVYFRVTDEPGVRSNRLIIRLNRP